MSTYSEIKRDIEKKLNEVPMFFAFSNEQLYKHLEEKKLEIKDIYKLPSGGLIAKTEIDKYHEWLNYSVLKLKEIVQDDKILFQSFKYELGNHEYCFTGDKVTVIESIGLEYEEVIKDERIMRIFKEAVQEYLDACNY
jgi:hypothetical protein